MAQYLPPAVSQELVPVVWKEQWMPMKRFVLGSSQTDTGVYLRPKLCMGTGRRHRI
jgi:hypothetical protein